MRHCFYRGSCKIYMRAWPGDRRSNSGCFRVVDAVRHGLKLTTPLYLT